MQPRVTALPTLPDALASARYWAAERRCPVWVGRERAASGITHYRVTAARPERAIARVGPDGDVERVETRRRV